MISSSDIDKRARCLRDELANAGHEEFASRLNPIFDYGCYSTGNEWLEAVVFIYKSLIGDQQRLAPDFLREMQTTIDEIEEWLNYAARTAVRYTPQRETSTDEVNISNGPPLRRWLRDSDSAT